MSRYCNLHRCIWNDDKFPFVSDDCQLVFFHLMSTPMGTQFGLFKATIPGLAAEKRWPLERYEKAFREAFAKAFVKYDEKHQLVYLPHFMDYNKPNNPNVLKSWAREFHELPDCDLKYEFFQSFKASLESFGEGFRKAFREGFAKPSRKVPESVSESVSVKEGGAGGERNDEHRREGDAGTRGEKSDEHRREGDAGTRGEKSDEHRREGDAGTRGENHPPETFAMAEHAWQSLLALFPPRNGKLHDLEECKLKFLSMPADWNEIIRCGKNYAASREVADGAVMNLMTFLSRRKFRNWLEPEQPLGGDDHMARSAKEELWRALRNENNRGLPAISDDARKLFYSIAHALGINWAEMQLRALAGERILDAAPVPKGTSPPVRDVKCAAAGDDL